MKPNFYIASIICGALPILTLAGPPDHSSKKSVEEPLQQYDPLYLGTFNTGVKSSDVYTEGHLSLVVPMWSTLGSDGALGGGVIYLEPYTSLGESGELATSLGLGWRYLFNDQPVAAMKSDAPAGFFTEGIYIGANVFVDNLRTQFDNDFWQLGLGVEVGSRYLEVRGNYYLPFDSSPKLAERTTSTQKFKSRSTQSSTRLEGSTVAVTGDPLATGNSIQQEVNITNTFATTTRTTTTTTTVKTITSLFEEGMEGWDVEAAVLIPGLDKYLEVSLLAGYYSFDNQPFGPQRGGSGNTEGFKAGIEIRPLPAIVITGMWYEDEGLTGSDWVAGIGLQIPLGKDWKDAFKSRRRHLIERLAEPVARQNAAIKTALSVDVDQQVKQQSKTRTAVRRTVTQEEGRIIIAEDIVFVNNEGSVGNGIAAGSAAGDGTAENPYDTIQAAADAAGDNNVATQRVWTVYTQATPTIYNESIAISASTRFTSSYLPIVSPVNGAQFGGNTLQAVVQGGFAADRSLFIGGSAAPTLVEVSGYAVTGGYSAAGNTSTNILDGVTHPNVQGIGILILNVDEAVIHQNIVNSTLTSGIGVVNDGLQQHVSIVGNTVGFNVDYGIFVDTLGADVDGEISGNTLSGNGSDGLSVRTGDADFNGDILDNSSTFHGSSEGISVFVDGDFNGNVIGNETVNNRMGLVLSMNGTFNGMAFDNEANFNTFYGFRSGAGSLADDAVTGPNTAVGNGLGDFHNLGLLQIITP